MTDGGGGGWRCRRCGRRAVDREKKKVEADSGWRGVESTIVLSRHLIGWYPWHSK